MSKLSSFEHKHAVAFGHVVSVLKMLVAGIALDPAERALANEAIDKVFGIADAPHSADVEAAATADVKA